MNKSNVTLFPEYRKLDLSYERPKVENHITCESDPMLSQIFVPDPESNIPRSDIHLILSKDQNPIVSQFIRDNLMQPVNSGDSGVDNPDMALDMVKSRGEDIYHYAQRMRDYIRSHHEDDKNS